MPTHSIVYFGDTSLDSAAAYLAGMLTRFGFGLHYVPSNRAADANDLAGEPSLFILSDYPSQMMARPIQEQILQKVAAGAGLLMLGGWESFHGAGGDWDSSALAAALPVQISTQDDRVNCDQPAIVAKITSHPIVDDLPWNERPPLIGGYNAFVARSGAQTLLEVERFGLARVDGVCHFTAQSRAPLLVVGEHGRGRTAALATDVAPHWVGGLVDWGDSRFVAAHPQSYEIEVGSYYAAFFRQLVSWTGQLSSEQILN